MAQAGFTPILIYASGTATNVPAAGNLTSSASGAELAINYADGKLYYKDSGGSVQLIASKSGASGDVVGPASATDNAIVRFDGTTGKLVQNSVVTIADSTGDISGVGVLNATTLDATNIEVTNIKAKDGTAAASIADSTGKITVSTELAVDNLNLSGNTLSSTDTNGNIVLAPNGTGDVQLDADTVRIGDSNVNATLTTNGTGDLILNTNSGTNSGSITIADGANGDMTLTPNGNGSVVITNNGTSNALRITQTGSGNALLVEDSANPDATPFVINSGGQTTVGYTSQPWFITGVAPLFGVVGIDNLTATSSIARYSNDSSQAWLMFGKSRGASIGTNTIVQNGDNIGSIDFSAADGTSNIPAARITASVDGTPGTNDMPGRLVFFTTADGASNVTERMRIDSAGNVGIGTTSPSYKLDIYGGSLGTTAGNQIIAQQLRVLTSNDDKLEFSKIRVSSGADWTTAGWRLQQKVDATWHGYIQFNGDNNEGISFGTGSSTVSANSVTERMRIDSAGRVGIGTSPTNESGVYINQTSTAANGYGLINSQTAGSTTTNFLRGFQTSLNTTAASFTLSSLSHFYANQGTIGAGSTVTDQYGYVAGANLTGATNNYGFFSNIASGTGRWNFYAAGTAANYFVGRLSLADPTDVGAGIFANYNISGSGGNGYGIKQNNTVTSSVTTNYFQYQSLLYTQATAFTLSGYRHYSAGEGVIGAGSTVTNQYGFIAESSLTGATNNYGFFSNIASGTGRWNFYAGGTAANYFAGDMQLDKTVTATGTTGAQTINKNAGTVNFAAAATSLVVTDSRVTANSIIICTVGTNDTTMKSVAAVAGAGSFTLHANAAATAETRVNFLIIN